MAGLRTLLQYTNTISGGSSTINYDELAVYNTNIETNANGGRCCLWTVPTGVTWVYAEMWGGGGAGAGACCCFGGWPGGSGSYSRKIISGLSAGQTLTLCAAGSTDCVGACCGQSGFPSYITNSGGTTLICASGGSFGGTKCYFMINCDYNGCQQNQCGSYCGTFGICGVTGSAKGSTYCSGNSYQYMPSAPFMGHNRPTKDACSGFCGGLCVGGWAHWPGGGGASTYSHTNPGGYCGAPGAGGLIQIFWGAVV
jgi:hypothetical protein